MDLDVFKASGQFYTRGPGTAEPVRWIKDDGYWVSNREEIPESANKVSLEELPTELQEEMLAYAVRTSKMGIQYRNPMN